MVLSQLALAALLSGANALLPLVTEGNKFYQLQEDYTKSPESFTIFGVDYQPGGSSGFNLGDSSDVLTDAEACQRDAYLLRQLGANAIRVYSVSPWLNHDKCMTILNDAGIYVLLDVNTPDSSLHRNNPGDSYNSGYLNNVFGLVDAFKKFPNLMGFIAGNEIINDGPSAKQDPPYIRAVIRDIKQYIYEWSNRTIPVGYAAADVLEYRTETWNYLECNADLGNSTDVWSRADFFGINSYEWCSGVNDYQSSGYGDIKSTFANSSIPIIFTEYGCNTKSPRTFDEVDQGIYGPLADVASGGFVYEYSNEVSNYGLVNLDDDGNVSLRDDFNNLKSAFAKVNTTATTPTATATGTGTAALKGVPTCSSASATGGFDWDFDLPPCPASNLISSNGGNRNVGSLYSFTSTVSNNYTIKDAQGKELTPTFSYDKKFQVNYQTNVPSSLQNQAVRGSQSSSGQSSSSSESSTSTSSSSSSQSSSSSTKQSSSSPSKSSSAKSSSTGKDAKSKKNGASSSNSKLSMQLGVSATVGLLMTLLL